jgi:hypothetical protein
MLNLCKSGSTSLWGATTLMGDVINSGKHVRMKTKWKCVNKAMILQHNSQQSTCIPH